MLYYNTPMSQAVLKIFENLDAWIKENYVNVPHDALKVYLFGGCAMCFYTNTRFTNDIDAELVAIDEKLKDIRKHIQEHLMSIMTVDFEDEDGLACALDFDGRFNITLPPLDPDYRERAKMIHKTKSKSISLYLVSAVDIAVSKIHRLSPKDRKDIEILYQKGFFTREEFLEIAQEAKKYFAIKPEGLQLNIDDVYTSL